MVANEACRDVVFCCGEEIVYESGLTDGAGGGRWFFGEPFFFSISDLKSLGKGVDEACPMAWEKLWTKDIARQARCHLQTQM